MKKLLGFVVMGSIGLVVLVSAVRFLWWLVVPDIFAGFVTIGLLPGAVSPWQALKLVVVLVFLVSAFGLFVGGKEE